MQQIDLTLQDWFDALEEAEATGQDIQLILQRIAKDKAQCRPTVH